MGNTSTIHLRLSIHSIASCRKVTSGYGWLTASIQQAKLSLSSSKLLHYDPSLPLPLAADASTYDFGAVIPHTMPNGAERPIAYAFRTLSTSEQKYTQLEKES